jgi:hypothetical protein
MLEQAPVKQVATRGFMRLEQKERESWAATMNMRLAAVEKTTPSQ